MVHPASPPKAVQDGWTDEFYLWSITVYVTWFFQQQRSNISQHYPTTYSTVKPSGMMSQSCTQAFRSCARLLWVPQSCIDLFRLCEGCCHRYQRQIRRKTQQKTTECHSRTQKMTENVFVALPVIDGHLGLVVVRPWWCASTMMSVCLLTHRTQTPTRMQEMMI